MPPAPARVLLIEDDLLDQTLFKRTLAKTHADIVCVGRLDDALDALAHTRFDLVVSDLNLPDSRGTETYDRLKAAAGDTPVVLITGYEAFVQSYARSGSAPFVFLKNTVHHDIFPLIALGRMLEHLLEEPTGADAPR